MGATHGFTCRSAHNIRIDNLFGVEVPRLGINSKHAVNAPSRFSPSTSKVSQSSQCNLATQAQCPLCKGTHRLFQCSKFTRMPPRQCYDYAQQIRACYNCLQPFSKPHIRSKHACQVCNKRHHTLLHVSTQTSSASNKRPITSHNPSANE